MKYLSEYVKYLEDRGYTVEYVDTLNGRLDAIDCYNGDDLVSLIVHETPEYSEYLDSLGDNAEYEPDYSKYIVTSAHISSPITTERNYFDYSNGAIYLSDKSDYHTHSLSLFEKCVDIQRMSLLEHEKFIIEQHLKNLEWICNVLAPELKKYDYKVDYSSLFDTDDGGLNSNLTIVFEHYNEGECDLGIITETDCITGELKIDPKELKDKKADEIWDVLVEYWKNQPLPEKYSYLYTEGKAKEDYNQYLIELEKLREDHCKCLKHQYETDYL